MTPYSPGYYVEFRNARKCLLQAVNAVCKELIASAENDVQAFYNKGNKAAGTRLRGAMQQLKVLATDIRKEVTEKKSVK